MIQHNRLIAILLSTLILTFAATSRGAEGSDTDAIRTMFTRIDLDYPGLQNVKSALNRDDLPAAEEAYLTFWRERQDRKVLWNPSGRFSSLENRTGASSDFFRVHPVMISWRDREKLKGQIHTDCAWADFGTPTRWTLLTMADLMLENRLVHLRVGNAPPREMGSPWIIQGDHEWRHYFMPVLAQAYWLTGDDKYVSKLVEVWKTWIHNHAAAFSKTQWHARAFYAMQHAVHQTPTIEMVLESPALTPRDFCLIIANLSGGTIEWLTAVPPMGANCTPAQVLGILTIATALPEFKDSTQWVATAQKYLAGFLPEEAYPDGGFAETTFSYSIGTALPLLSCVYSLKVSELPVPEELLSRSEKWGEHFLYLARPDYLLPWTGHGVRIHAFDLLTQLAKMHPHRQDFLYYATQGKEGRRPENPSRWFNWSGYCSMRDRYDPTANYLFFDVGPCGKNHKNANKLQIEVASHGRTLLEDRGNHTYSADSEFNTYFNYCYGHSTVLVDGKSQPLREEVSTAPLTNPWTSTAVLDYNAGEYSGGYHPTSYVAGAVDNGVRHYRSVIFVKPDYWIVTDRLLPTGKDDPDRARTFEQLFQYIPREITEHRDSLAVSSATPGEPNLALIPVSREGLELEIAQGRRKPFILGWAVLENEPGGHVQKDTTASRRPFGERAVEPAPTVIYRKRAIMPAVMQTVLWPMKAGHTQRPRVEQLGEPGDGAVKVTLPDGRVDWYRSSAAPCAMEVGGVSFHDALAALVRLDSQGNVVAKDAVKQ